MVEVTDEMVRAGLEHWEAHKATSFMPQLIAAMFLAMRALEKPMDHFGLSPRGITPEAVELADDKRDRRLDDLTALVLKLARRVPGWQYDESWRSLIEKL